MSTNYDTLYIDTPENVTFDYDVSGIGSRFLAAFVDAIVLGLVEGIIFGALLWIILAFQDVMDENLQTWVTAAFSLLGFIFFWAYHSFFEILWNGQTPGKRLVGVRVIRLDGTPVAATEVLIRNLVRIFDFLPAAYGIGVVTMFFNQNSRRLGDLAAGTIVVHEHGAASLKSISRAQVNESAVIYMPVGFPVEKLDQKDLLLIEDFLTRREALSNRHTLASHLLNSIMAKHEIAIEVNDHLKADAILEAIHGTIQNRSAANDNTPLIAPEPDPNQ